MAFSYLHANVIDIVGTTIIIISIKGGFIKTHVEFIKKGFFFMVGKLLYEGQNIL
jgi:hypothetical protein